MQKATSIAIRRAFPILAMLLVWKVTLSVVSEYRNYLPPNFESDFLRGRQGYFWGGYQWAFYTHLVAGPASLLVGTLLISNRFRAMAPAWHRGLGRVQGVCVLLLVVPSGLWMAWYAAAGPIAAAGLGSLAVATAICVALGWRSAVKRRFAEHRHWMWRAFLLLCSAVVIRLIGGLATVTHFDPIWLNPLAAWVSWLGPLLVYEVTQLFRMPAKRVAPANQ